MLGYKPLCVVAVAITCLAHHVRGDSDTTNDGNLNVPFNIKVAAKFVAEILEAMLVYISFRLTLQRSFLQDTQRKICIRSIDRSALAGLLISIIFTVVVSIGCFSAKERLRGGLNIYGWPIHSIVRIFLGLLTGFMSLRIPFILGLYHKPILAPRITEELALRSPLLSDGRLHCSVLLIFKKIIALFCSLVDRFFHYRLGFLVAWTVLREGIMLGMYIASISGTRELDALPLSVTVGIAIPAAIMALYIFISRRFLNRKWLGIVACSLMGLLATSLFGRGLYVNEDSIFHTPGGIHIKFDTGSANGMVMALLAPVGWLHDPTVLQEVGWFVFAAGMLACHVYMFLRYGPRNYPWLPARWREEKLETQLDPSMHKLAPGGAISMASLILFSPALSADLSGAGSSRCGRNALLSGRGMVFSGSRVFARSTSLRSFPLDGHDGPFGVREGFFAPRGSPSSPRPTRFRPHLGHIRSSSYQSVDLELGLSFSLRGERPCGANGGSFSTLSRVGGCGSDDDVSFHTAATVQNRDLLARPACGGGSMGVERMGARCSWGGEIGYGAEIEPMLPPDMAVGDTVDEVVGVPCWQLARFGAEVRWNAMRSAARVSPKWQLLRSHSANF